MRRGLTYVLPFVLVAGGVAMMATACGSDKRDSFAAADAGGDVTPGLVNGPVPCAGLECKRATCDDGSTTTLTGKVYDPAGANALYNVMVYIPKDNVELPEIPEGVACETCSSVALNPMVSALTDTKGEFTLENVPVDKDVPVIVQIGKWRRALTIDITKKCEANKVPDREFRLPKNSSEGNMPQIAVTAGGCDALECLLRGIGVDESEFVPGPSTAGHIHVYNGEGGEFPGAPAAGGTLSAPMSGQLWNDPAKMAAYDMVMLSCECGETLENKGNNITGARQSMWDYANMGGRIFATHYHYTWFKNSPQNDWRNLANWTPSGGTSGAYDVVQTLADGSPFPKGEALADWLFNINASPSKGHIQLTDVTASLSSVKAPAQSWIQQGANTVKYFSFNAPIGEAPENQCGRAVYSDLHLMGVTAGGQAFPAGCPSPGGLSAQQKALEFMFFDLSACVQGDDIPPNPPK